MADPTANKNVPRRGTQTILKYGMDGAAATLYMGQLVMLDATGFLVKAASTASCAFVGVANDKYAQATTATDGTNKIDVQTEGEARLTVTSVAQTSVGAPVWITDSGACQLTPSEVFVGWVTEYETTNTAWVKLAPPGYQPRRYYLPLVIDTSAASTTSYSPLFTAQQPTAILGCDVNAFTFPNYGTVVFDLDKRDIGTTATVAVVTGIDIDNKTAFIALPQTLTTVAADKLLADGDSIWASITTNSVETTAHVALTATLELAEYGQGNA
jgi:hypothetical protein